MRETYYLNHKNLPTIPEPHDCIIKEIRLEEEKLIFIFEDDISYHESIEYTRPEAKTLTITFHLKCGIYDINLLKRNKPYRLFRTAGIYREMDLSKSTAALLDLPDLELSYLYHYVRYNAMVIELNALRASSVILELTTDYVEFDWIDK